MGRARLRNCSDSTADSVADADADEAPDKDSHNDESPDNGDTANSGAHAFHVGTMQARVDTLLHEQRLCKQQLRSRIVHERKIM